MSGPAVGARGAGFHACPPPPAAAFSLAAARGAPLVLYFYPRDNTPGCTLEAQDFQRLLPAFRRRKARVCGISRDSLAAHGKFCARYGLRLRAAGRRRTAPCAGAST